MNISLFKSKYYFIILNCISACLIIVCIFIIGYLESTDISVINFFGNTRESFFEQNQKEIHRVVFDGKSVKFKTSSETSTFDNLEFFNQPDEQNIVLFLKNGDHILIHCKKHNYLKLFQQDRLLNYLNQFNGLSTYISEKAGFLSKLHQLMLEIFHTTPKNNKSSSQFILPRAILLFYDPQLGICAMKAEQEKSCRIGSEASFYDYLLLPDNI